MLYLLSHNNSPKELQDLQVMSAVSQESSPRSAGHHVNMHSGLRESKEAVNCSSRSLSFLLHPPQFSQISFLMLCCFALGKTNSYSESIKTIYMKSKALSMLSCSDTYGSSIPYAGSDEAHSLAYISEIDRN